MSPKCRLSTGFPCGPGDSSRRTRRRRAARCSPHRRDLETAAEVAHDRRAGPVLGVVRAQVGRDLDRAPFVLHSDQQLPSRRTRGPARGAAAPAPDRPPPRARAQRSPAGTRRGPAGSRGASSGTPYRARRWPPRPRCRAASARFDRDLLEPVIRGARRDGRRRAARSREPAVAGAWLEPYANGSRSPPWAGMTGRTRTCRETRPRLDDDGEGAVFVADGALAESLVEYENV